MIRNGYVTVSEDVVILRVGLKMGYFQGWSDPVIVFIGQYILFA